MKVLSNGNGSFLVEDDDEALQWYLDNDYQWEDTGGSVRICGNDELFDDIEIDGDPDGSCNVTISYLVHRGGARYERVTYQGRFEGRELVGKWEEIDE